MYSFESRVRYSECDGAGVLTYTALIDYLQDCCTFQSEDLGVGTSYLKEEGLGWFVTSWDIRIFRMPRIGERITVSTMPYALRGVFGSRNFAVTGADNETLVEADSLWILMNMNKGCPARLTKELSEAFSELDPPLAGNKKRARLAVAEDAALEGKFVVDTMYLDSNNHMNNGYYVEAALGVLRGDFPMNNILVEYKRSAVLGDEVYCFVSSLEQGQQVALCNEEREPFAIVEFLGEMS